MNQVKGWLNELKAWSALVPDLGRRSFSELLMYDEQLADSFGWRTSPEDSDVLN